MKRWSMIALALLMLLCGCAANPDRGTEDVGSPPGTASAQTQYQQERRNEISDMILAREIVPQDYFRYLDEETAEQVEEYNRSTVSLRDYYVKYALEALLFVTETRIEEEFDCYDLPDIQYQWISRISRYALYENAEYLCRGDELLSYPCGMESGGSSGMWVGRMHSADYVGPEIAQMVEDYFALVDGLLTRLEEQA